jgi:hypothetical protein
MYSHGENMCSTAALCMCIAMVSKNACKDLCEQVASVMDIANNAHRHIRERSGNQLASVADIVKHMGLDGFMKHVGFHEYVICEEGCTEMTNTTPELEEPVSCLISRTLLTRCLASHSRGGRIVAAVLTCDGHSVSVSKKNDEYSLFDSGPSFLMVEMNATQFDEKMNEIIVGQCDVTVIYSSQCPQVRTVYRNPFICTPATEVESLRM